MLISACDMPLGLPVYGSGGDNVGKLRFVVAEPQAPYAVKFVVIERGSHLGRDLMIPVENVISTENREIRLNLDTEGVKNCQEFVDSHYFAGGRDYQQAPTMMPNKPSRGRRSGGRRPHYGGNRSNQGRL